MKTVKGLHEKMGTFENANTSFHQAARCKRYTNEVLAFSMVKEEELLRATEEIQNLTYRQGEYKIFKVFEPKERLIMALPFYDRVVQHMICNAIQPVFENGFYYHSYACRSGKGMHAASDTLYQWMYETEVKQALDIHRERRRYTMAVTAAQVKKVVKVASGIIYSQEGNYGSVNRNDNNHGMSIGKCQWNAYWGRALPLLKSIVEKDQEQAKEILGDALYTEIAGSSADAWNRQEREATEEEANAISKLLTTKDGKEVQDDLADADITGYVKNGVKIGLVSLKALAYFADLENQGGSGASSRIAKTAAEATGGAEKVGLEEIHAYALKDATMGQYESRRSKVYEAIKGSNLTDVSHTKTEEKQNTPQKPQETPTGVSKGDIVTFTGGGVYISSTAEYAAKEKDVVSTCKVTAVNEKGTHKYHCISQDGKGVYGWVNAESIKELSSKAHSDPASVSKGDIVTFTGGGVYKSSTAEYASVQKNVTSTCKVTAVNTKGTHPYHCISQDGKGVYGWVNAADVK